MAELSEKPDPYAPQYRLRFPRDGFLRAIGAVYAAAFASIAHQIRGLYGVDGLEPVDVFLDRLKQRNSQLASATPVERIAIYPTVVWLYEVLDWSPSFMLQLIAVTGLTISLLTTVSASWRTTLPMGMLWFGYLSIVQCGQTFMRFQWDSFLLEVGFLVIWIAPWWHTKSDSFQAPASIVWTLRFLFFKFMLMSGAVKIQSKCPTWLGLTALEYHFATQPLPLPLSWYAHQVPPIFLRVGVAATLLFEGPWTFFILAPTLVLRQFSVVMQILLQILVMLTGNYNFFNILTVVIAVAMLDEQVPVPATQVHEEPSGSSSGVVRGIRKLDDWWQSVQQDWKVVIVSFLVAVLYCVYTSTEVFAVGVDATISATDLSWEAFIMAAWIRFLPTVDETQGWIARVLPNAIISGAILITAATAWQVTTLWANITSSNQSRGSQFVSTVYLLTSSTIAALVFCSSALTLSTLDRPFQQSLPPFVYEAYESTSQWRITSAYGLFRTMTGVGSYQIDGKLYSVVARPEIVLEGTDDGGASWKAYHFVYKPGDVDVAPKVNVPFQPRLDWQMWFAALGDYQAAPWIVHLIDKLLHGSPDVKALLDSSRDPFPAHPPHAIRAQLYYYDFTRLNTTWSRAIPTASILTNASERAWWSRTLFKEYVPALEQGNPSLAQFVHHHFGRDATAAAHDFTCDSTSPSSSPSLVCRSLQPLVVWPAASAFLLAGCVLLVACGMRAAVASVPMSQSCTTQLPKSKME